MYFKHNVYLHKVSSVYIHVYFVIQRSTSLSLGALTFAEESESQCMVSKIYTELATLRYSNC